MMHSGLWHADPLLASVDMCGHGWLFLVLYVVVFVRYLCACVIVIFDICILQAMCRSCGHLCFSLLCIALPVSLHSLLFRFSVALYMDAL